MRRLRFCALIFLALTPTLRSRGSGAHASAVYTHLWIPMRDGVKLAANLFRPGGAGRLPTILVRTPYGKGTEISNLYQALVDRGYNVVAEDVRGRYESEGSFTPLTQEPADGDDTLDWIAAQLWSDGKIGMTGGSYLGFTQWDVAVHNNPHLKAIFPVVSGDDNYRDRIYSPGGAMKWGHRLEWVAENMRTPGYVPPDFQKFIWTLPPRRVDSVITGASSNMLQAAFDHPSYDAFWKKVSAREKLKECKVPVFSVAGWYDNYAEGDLDAFAILRKHTGVNRIVVGPWPHNMSAPIKTVDFGPSAALPLRRMQMEWFDEWLKSKDVPLISTPPVRLFVMGADVWRDENEWPLARTITTKLYLDSNGHANSLTGDGALTEQPVHKRPNDHFTYDPRTPVPTMGGAVCCNPKVFPWGPMDQRKVEKRNDVLVYTSPPLREPIEVTGQIALVLYAATSARDTDFTGKLIDVYPDGRSMNLTDGIVRARYRDGIEKPELLDGKDAVKYTIDLGVTSNLFKKGHRIRLEVSSSNFPRFDRNPNTGGPIADETRLVPASQTIYHDGRHRSYLLLPEIPGTDHLPQIAVTKRPSAE